VTRRSLPVLVHNRLSNLLLLIVCRQRIETFKGLSSRFFDRVLLHLGLRRGCLIVRVSRNPRDRRFLLLCPFITTESREKRFWLLVLQVFRLRLQLRNLAFKSSHRFLVVFLHLLELHSCLTHHGLQLLHSLVLHTQVSVLLLQLAAHNELLLLTFIYLVL